MTPLPKVKITCLNTGVSIDMEVLRCSSRQLKVVSHGDVTITLHRDTTHKPYIGHVGQLEFQADANSYQKVNQP